MFNTYNAEFASHIKKHCEQETNKTKLYPFKNILITNGVHEFFECVEDTDCDYILTGISEHVDSLNQTSNFIVTYDTSTCMGNLNAFEAQSMVQVMSKAITFPDLKVDAQDLKNNGLDEKLVFLLSWSDLQQKFVLSLKQESQQLPA